MKPSHPFPQPLEITRVGDFTHSHRTTATGKKKTYTDISNGLATLTFLMSSNKQMYAQS